MKNTRKEEEKHYNKYAIDQPIAGGALVMMAAVGVRVKKTGAGRQKKKHGRNKQHCYS